MLMRYVPERFDLFNDFFKENMRKDMMKTDILRKDGLYTIDIEMPGVNKEDMTVELKDGYLRISADQSLNEEKKNERGDVVYSERSFGHMSRSFFVGNDVKKEDIRAKYHDGVLSITIPEDKQERKEEKILID